jgi:hypothetical protein
MVNILTEVQSAVEAARIKAIAHGVHVRKVRAEPRRLFLKS